MAGNSSTSPKFGKIYSLRQSVQKAISLINHYYEFSSFTISSVPSSSSSNVSATTNTKRDRSKSRPCICWDFNDESYKVLVITSFDGRNPMGPLNDRQSMESNIPKQSLLKYLVSIDPTPPTPGRRAITIERSPNTKSPEHPNNMFLILMPIKVELDMKWPQPDDVISSNDLLYISDLLAELDKERKQKMISNSSSTPLDIPLTRNLQNSFIQMDDNNSKEDDRNSTTSDSSDCAFMFQEHIDTRTQVIEWLKYDFEERR